MLRRLDLVGKWASRVEKENKAKESCCSLLSERYSSQSLLPTSSLAPGLCWRTSFRTVPSKDLFPPGSPLGWPGHL